MLSTAISMTKNDVRLRIQIDDEDDDDDEDDSDTERNGSRTMRKTTAPTPEFG